MLILTNKSLILCNFSLSAEYCLSMSPTLSWKINKYSRTSMAPTGLGPWILFLAKGSSTHPGWIMHKMTCRDTVNPLYNKTVCSKLSLTLKWICCYKEILTITRFPQNNHLVKENIIQMILFQMYTSVQFHISSKYTKLPTHQVRQKPVHAKKPCSDHKIVWHMVTILL